MAGQKLQVEVSVGTDGLVSGLKVATKGVEDASQQMRTSLRTLADTTTSAQKTHEGFLDTLRNYKQEQTQAARTASFYAASIAEVIPGADAARGAIKGLIGVLLEGGGVGAGFELAVFAVAQFKDAIEAEEKRVAELRKAHRQTLDEISDAVKQATDKYKGWRTETEKLGESLEDSALKKIRQLRGEIDDLAKKRDSHIFGDLFGSSDETDAINQKLALIRQLNADLNSPKTQAKLQGAQDEESIAAAKKTTQELIALNHQSSDDAVRVHDEAVKRIEEIDEQLNDARSRNDLLATSSLENLRASTIAAANTRINDMRVAREVETQARVLQIHSASMTEIERLQADERSRIAEVELQFRHRLDQSNKAAIIAAIKDETRLRISEAQARIDYERQLGKQAMEKEARDRAAIDLAITEEKKQVWKDAGQALAQSLTYGFERAAQGALDFGAVVGTVLKSVLSTTLSVIQRSILAYAAESAAKAFSSQAAIPIVGPILGAAAAASALGLVSGFVAKIPGFAEGGRYQGGPMIVGERGPELLVPDSAGTVVPNHALGGFTINISAMDGASVRRVVESPDFVRAIREAQRNGRL